MLRRPAHRAVAAAAAVALTATLTPAAASAAQGRGAGDAPPGKERLAEQYVDRTLESMTLEEKIGQLFILFAYGPSADTADPRNTKMYGEASAAEIVDEYEPGGFILFSARDNVTDPEQVATLSNGLQAAAAGGGGRPPPRRSPHPPPRRMPAPASRC